MKDGLTAVHVPYAYGFAIILLAPYLLTKQQVSLSNNIQMHISI